MQEKGGRAWLNDLKNNEATRKAFKAGEWNKLLTEWRDDSIKTWLDDVLAADFKDDRARSGFIGPQMHGAGENEKAMEVRFCNIRLKEL